MKFSNKKALVWDAGLFTEHAVRIARDFDRVFHYTFWQTDFPNFNNYIIGKGMENITKVDKFFDYIDRSDLIFFPDVHTGDVVEHLRRSGKVVFGAGKGEILELDREEGHRYQELAGLPVQDYLVIRGVDNLEKFILENRTKNYYVKIDKFRENLESLKTINYKSAKIILDSVRATLGPFADDFKFIVEPEIDGVCEPGFDLIFNGSDFIKPYLWGYEYKSAYLGVYTDTLPGPIARVTSSITPVLRHFGYRGAISCEMIVTSDGQPYCIDWTCRFPSPLSVLYTDSIKNYTEVIWNVASGQPVTIENTSKYVGILSLESEYAANHWLKIEINPQLRKNIKFRRCAGYGGQYYAVPGLCGVVVLCAYENTIEKVIRQLTDLLNEVDAYQLRKEELCGGLEHIKSIVDSGRKAGLEF